ncbi:EamA domain-containing membrane protein RarD [Sporobacter termitidis DSM 10068]|uniref:EamA domain-containing membrane protein RarD n=1 Tax=Sporobacter termitidis DSM 10068 TaxID=1123282 RepID=A0A1M5Z912_9FIRM|nr:DMT family transporter [Sporobacter termitidis]SHI20721.1 EamA domain-containing membrane protein RarD [Sporobacter termitidis DSM 10068]
MKFKNSFHPYAIITIVFWSCAYVLSRLALAHFSAYALGLLRYIIATVVMLAVILFNKMKRPAPRDLLWFLAAGACGFTLYMIAFNTGCETVNSSTSSVIIAIVPVVTSVMARVIYRERLTVVQWLSTGVSFAGVVVLTALSGGLAVNAGILWLLAAVVFLSLFNILQRKLTKTYSPLQTSAFSIFAGTLLLGVFLPSSIAQAATAPAIQWVYLIILGVGSSAIAYLAWAMALARAEKTSSVTNYMFVTPFLASVMGVVIGGEEVRLPTVIGGLVIIAGLVLFNLGGRWQKRRSAAPAAEHAE